ncbi:hypothetical protein AVEN_136952-1 [Araneus ventricosus]|uniref:DUF4773 domain-containing protein n=1 Tax=Araneus ventricosus TaxID=182803 RepID=A0A4Y2BGU0_ARAVE|nr:hypothetical protein AVEN_136952-1 [Araneus ventricosus]
MTKLIFCCLLLFICFASYVLGKPVKLREAENVRDGCACENFTCSCCVDLVIPQISLNDSICLSFGYEPKTYGISFVLAIDGKVLINETISATNPPPICVSIPFIKEVADACVHFSDLSISKKKFYGCAQLELRMWWVYVVSEYKLGCFNANNISNQHAKFLKLISKFKGSNTTEKANVIEPISVHPKTLQ